MTMLDMMFNEQEKKKMMEGFALMLTQAIEAAIDRKLTAIEQAVERVLVKHGLAAGVCNCGADRTGPSAEAHDKTCPAYIA